VSFIDPVFSITLRINEGHEERRYGTQTKWTPGATRADLNRTRECFTSGRTERPVCGANPAYGPLSVTEVDRLIEANLEVMRDAGCTASDEGVVCLPSEIVRRCLDNMARSARPCDCNGTDFVEIYNRHTWFIPGMTCIGVCNESGEPRASSTRGPRADQAHRGRAAERGRGDRHGKQRRAPRRPWRMSASASADPPRLAATVTGFQPKPRA
jgi:hypothetical protein